MGENTVNFIIVADMLERISKLKKYPMKRKVFRTFLDHFYTDREYYSVMRLILPELDRERGNYGLKESVLAKCLAEALGLAKGSKDAERLVNWRKGGSDAGEHAGNFARVATEIVGSRQRSLSGELKVKQVNDMLDALVVASKREEKSKILSELINKTNPLEMKWIIMIILKQLKLGISEKTFFKEFHPDAEDVYNKTCDLKYVCEKLTDPKIRFKRQDIEVGKPVRPQLASRTANVESAWKKLRGKRLVAECKFDGDRCQVHKDGTKINFFSRSSIDHKEFADAMSHVILGNVLPEKCILDGEMVVWNRVTQRFEEFGKNQEVAKKARDGEESDEQLCYVAFDILYLQDASVIHQPLHERQRLLFQSVKPVAGRLELLQPDRQNCGGLWSISVQTSEQIAEFFKMTVENRDEGIVIKDLDSKWEPGDRSGKWIKLKPDYVHPESDLDVLIIGGYFGSGRRGGEVAQFLLGVAERPKDGGYPRKFLSFCKVGSGLSDDECATLVSKLRPYFKRNDKPSSKPSCYIVTNNSKERPDVWVDPPDKSVILQIASDIRCIKSEVFASPYCLRFPRVHEVRYDKPWYDCLTVEELVEIVGKQSSSTVDVTGKKTKRAPKKRVSKPLLPEHLQQTDVSNVTKASELFRGMEFYIANASKDQPTEKLHKLVAEHGGKFSMNLTSSVTHVVADNNKGLRYQAAAKTRDVIHQSWLLDSIAAKKVLPFRPKYRLHLTSETRENLKDTVDTYGDHYFVDVDKDDIEQLFGGMRVEDLALDEQTVMQYKKRFGGKRLFEGCAIYFHRPDDRDIVADTALRRLEIEVEVYRGAAESSISEATTHIVVFWEEGSSYQVHGDVGLSSEQQSLVSGLGLQVLSHEWLEDALELGRLPRMDEYEMVHPVLVNEDTGMQSPAGAGIEPLYTLDIQAAARPVDSVRTPMVVDGSTEQETNEASNASSQSQKETSNLGSQSKKDTTMAMFPNWASSFKAPAPLPSGSSKVEVEEASVPSSMEAPVTRPKKKSKVSYKNLIDQFL